MFVFLSSSMWVQGLLSPAGVFRDISFGLSCPFHCGSSVLLPFVSGLSLGFVFGLLFAIYLLQFFHIHRQRLQLPTNLCPLPVSQQGVGLAAAFQVICMSDQNLIALTFAIERLTLSTERLAQELHRHRLATSTSDSPVPPIAAASVEGGRVPFPGEFVNHCALLRYRGAEDGPGSVPAFAVLHCVEKLSADKAPGPEERAKFAYRSGFWASIAISTRTGFNQVQAQGLRNNHWIVLQSSIGAFRATSRREYEALVSLSDPALVYAVFDSLAEVDGVLLGSILH